MCLLALLPVGVDTHWNRFYTTEPNQQTCCKKTGQQATALFSPPDSETRGDSTLVSYSLTALSSPQLSVAFLFSKEIWFPTFVHLSFLRGPRKIALIPFTWENPDLLNQRKKVISFHSIFQICSWLTWEHCISFTWAHNGLSSNLMNRETDDIATLKWSQPY